MTEPTTIGPYHIEREIGRGGMGVVSLAVDPRLGRRVAIKALPDAVADDPDRLARLDREARALASLNHPNIAQIYGVEEAEGRRYLVLEYVDGVSLDERLEGGALPVDEALEMAAQIARGVEAAHREGVVHRDLKPANIRLTPDGRVKVLDFGLAKATQAESSGSFASTESPTLTTPNLPAAATTPGAVLGTASYMSPEQARGKSVDHRTDIWSLGVVLYEALTGAGPFARESTADTLGAILHTEPDWSRLPPETPPTIALLLRRCLQRDRERRLQSIGDARVELQAALDDPSGTSLSLAGLAVGGPQRRRGIPAWAAGAAAALGLALGAALVWSLAPEPPAPRPIHLGVPLPPDVQQVTAVGVSPDGQTLAWVGLEGTGSRATLYSNVYVRSVHQPTTRRFPDTNGTQSVEFSPDGTRLLTWQIDQGAARFNVRVIPIDGGPPVTTLSTPFAGDLMAWSACWETNETLLILSRDGTRLMRVPASGGTPTEVATLEWDDEVPYSLRAPQGERGRVLISALSAEADGGEGGASRIHWIDLDTGRRRLLVDDGAGAFFTGGDVLTFLRIGDPSTVMTAPVDLDRGELTGPVRPRISDVSQVFAAAGDSVLYVPADASSLTESSIVAIDTSGAEEILHDSFAFYSDPRLSPDGRWLAFQALESGASFSRVWLLDLGSRLVRPLSASPDRAASPRWLPDGRLSYTVLSDDPRRRRCVVIDPRRGGSPEPLFPEQPDRALAFADLTSDGTYALAAYAPDDGREGGIYVHRVGSEDPPVEFFATSAVEGFVSISPDDRWVAFHSNSSGTYEVYLRRLAPDDQESAPVYPLSRGGGGWPTWSPDGRSIYYFGAADLVRVDVALGDGEAEISAPETVLQLDGMASNADVFPSGERFVCVRAGGGAEEGRELRVILDWPARWDR